MIKKIIMPDAGQTTGLLTVMRWFKAEGDEVKRGDTLLEVETDKAILPVESYADGILLKILVNEGETALEGDVLAYIGDATDEIEINQPQSAQSSAEENIESDVSLCISPAAKKAIRDAGLKPEKIPAAQKDMIKKADVERHLEQTAQMADYDLIPLTVMRKTIAAVMMQSVSTIPSYTMEIDVNISNLLNLRRNLQERGCKAAVHDILAKCTSQAVADYPLINASYTDLGIRQYRSMNIGIAVSIEGGLVVPVIRDIGGKSLIEIAKESAVLIEKARSGRLLPEDTTGGILTISNLGTIGISRFSAIIRPPESCILAIAASKPGQSIISITASFDHRLIDGAYGAAFLVSLRQYIENINPCLDQ